SGSKRDNDITDVGRTDVHPRLRRVFLAIWVSRARGEVVRSWRDTFDFKAAVRARWRGTQSQTNERFAPGTRRSDTIQAYLNVLSKLEELGQIVHSVAAASAVSSPSL